MTALEYTEGAILHCGWGRLLFAHTFPDPVTVAKAVLEERSGQRDIAFYLTDPHLVLNYAPQQLFLDPSNTYRLEFKNYVRSEKAQIGFTISPLRHKEELDAMNRILAANGMVQLDTEHVWEHRDSPQFCYLLARRDEGGEILGMVMGADHAACYDDLRNGCSLWALAVDPQAEVAGLGEWLTRAVVEMYLERGRDELDLSVMHDNQAAAGLYRKLGFERVAVFAVKNRNQINERLFVGTPPTEGYNPYAKIIINEALRRGITVDPFDPPRNFFRLILGARSVTCWESLTEMTSAIALTRTDDKQLTRQILFDAGLSVPDQKLSGEWHEDLAFLNRHKSVVVKPLHGEQGKGISVDVRTAESLQVAIDKARVHDDNILLEQFVEGMDLRVIVINGEAVAAAVREPPVIMGDGNNTIRKLVERLSRRRSGATHGESSIPVDDETQRCVELAGYGLEDILPAGTSLTVRKTANLHTGGTITDVTQQLHPTLANAAVRAAQALDIPVTGLDLIVPRVDGEEYAIIEANERPGLANHEPAPTAEKFIDFLFPQTIHGGQQ
ncbi:MAG: N-acetylglutaminylglutamine synthetase [Opitutales bacterium]